MTKLRNRAWGYLIGNQWRTFAGIPYEDFIMHVDAVLDRYDWEVQREEDDPTSSERTMYGSNKCIVYRISDPEFTLRCISVSYDPIHKAALSIGSSDEVLDQYKDSLTMVDIQPINGDTRPSIREFLKQPADKFDKPPWKFNHPRFDLAILLRYRVKYNWQYWLGESKPQP